MAELNLDYYTAKDHYSDGDIEETLLKMAQEGKSFEDLPEEEVSFPMVYHFSGLRENIWDIRNSICVQMIRLTWS